MFHFSQARGTKKLNVMPAGLGAIELPRFMCSAPTDLPFTDALNIHGNPSTRVTTTFRTRRRERSTINPIIQPARFSA